MNIALQLFQALDDVTMYVYYAYKKDGGEYPSESAIQALVNAKKEFNYESKALKIMDKNLASDIQNGF